MSTLGLLRLAAPLVVLVLLIAPNSAVANHVQCGDVITQDTTLDSDVVCPDGTPAALTIAADGVVLDLGGHLVANGHTDEGATVAIGTAAPVANVTLRNGTVQASDAAIRLQASDSLLEDLGVSGHLLALRVTGDRNQFVHLDVVSSHTALRIAGSDLRFERNRVRLTENEEIGGIVGDRNLVRRNEIGFCGTSALVLQGNGLVVERNTAIGCTLAVRGIGSRIERNTSGLSFDAGFIVRDPQAVISRNLAHDNGGSGIVSLEPGALVTRNTANDNDASGIEAVPGTIDGGGNRASGNGIGTGEHVQCTGVACK